MESAGKSWINIFLFIAISLIWGSSFILMKEGIRALSPYEVAALRLFSAGILLLPVAWKQRRSIPRNTTGWVILSGFLGTFFPAFLFCIAETRIESSLAGFLNSLTPVFTILVGILFFKNPVGSQKITGVVIALLGMVLLFLSKLEVHFHYFSYGGFVLLATLCYAFNVNLVNRRLKQIGSLNITALACAVLVIPAGAVLANEGFLQRDFSDRGVLLATGASTLLGILGTAAATILFYMLIKRAGVLFSSMVTYGMPFVALGWGLLAGETVSWVQVLGLAIILLGVYRTSR